DLAYNYSAGLATGISLPCSTPPTPGTTTSSATSIVCGGTNVTIGVTGSSFGSGQTYQLQESSSQTGPFTNVGTPQSVPSFNVQPAITTWYQVELICGATSATSTP